MKRRPKEAFDKWRAYIKAVNENLILNNLKSQKLKIALSCVTRRTLRDAVQRIIGEGSKVKGAIKQIYQTLQRMPKMALDKWKAYIVAIHKKQLFDGLRSQKLKLTLGDLVKRTIKQAAQRMIGGGNIIKGALMNVLEKLKARPKIALKNWKQYVEDIKNKKLFDGQRSARLKIALSNLPRRTMKEAYERVKGVIFASPAVKKILQRCDNLLKKRPKHAFDIWKAYTKAVNENMILNNLKSQKLRIALSGVTRRTLRDAMQRSLGEGSKVKGAIKQIYSTLQRMPKMALDRWKAYIVAIHKKQLFDGLRSQKLKLTLYNIIKRTTQQTAQRIIGGGDAIKGALINVMNGLKSRPQKVLRTWRKYVDDIKNKKLYDGARSQKLKNALTSLPRRTLREAYERVKGVIFASPAVKKTLQRCDNIMKRRPKEAFDKWRAYSKAVNENLILNNLKSQKLKIALSGVTRRTLRDSLQRIIGEGSKVKGAIKQIYNTLQRMPKMALDRWKAYIVAIHKKQLFDGLRSQKLKLALNNIIKRTTQQTTQRIIGGGDVVKGALINVMNGLSSIPKNALRLWRKYVEDIKNKKLFDGARSLKLKNSLERIPRRTSRDAVERLKGLIFLAPKVRASFKSLEQVLKRRPKFGLDKWLNFSKAVDKNLILNGLKSQKLKISLIAVTRRTLRDAVQRIIGEGSKVKGAIKQIYNTLIKKPKVAFDLWKAYIVAVNKRQLFDGIRSQRLKFTLSCLVIRTIKNTTARIIGGGSPAKGALEKLFRHIAKIPMRAYLRWKAMIQAIKDKKVLDNSRALRLKNSLERIPRKTSKDCFERIIGQGSKAIGAVRRLEIFTKKLPKVAFDKWSRFLADYNQGKILQRIKAEKLIRLMRRTPVRSLKDAYDRIIGDNKCVAGALRRLSLCIKNNEKWGFLMWKSKINTSKHSIVAKGTKLQVFLRKVVMRQVRSAFNRIIGDTRAKRALCRLVRNQMNQQTSCVEKLKERVYKVKLIRKISAAYILMRKLRSKGEQMLKGRYNMWKNMDLLKKRRLLRKYALKFISNTCICYQSGLWRWKHVIMHHWHELHPIHAIMYKRLSNIAFNYQRRLSQFALFKIVLFFRSSTHDVRKKSIQIALSSLIRASQEQEIERSKSPSAEVSRVSLGSIENPPAFISTISSTKLNKEEIMSINQTGGLEIIQVYLKEAKKRKMAWALASIFCYSNNLGQFDEERSRLVEQINELRYDKHSLLEDNTALRMHNEALIENLEKTNIEFASLSLHLDQMRIARMVRAISKMVDLPVLEALIMLKHWNPKNNNSSLISN